MYRFLGLVFALLTLVGCEKPPTKSEIDELRVNLAELTKRLEALERPATPTEAGRWVLWQRVQHLCQNCLYSGPKPVSAFTTRTECRIGAIRLVDPGGRKISDDPFEFEYADRRITFLCLPVGVEAK